jgi:hypothetical protein
VGSRPLVQRVKENSIVRLFDLAIDTGCVFELKHIKSAEMPADPVSRGVHIVEPMRLMPVELVREVPQEINRAPLTSGLDLANTSGFLIIRFLPWWLRSCWAKTVLKDISALKKWTRMQDICWEDCVNDAHLRPYKTGMLKFMSHRKSADEYNPDEIEDEQRQPVPVDDLLVIYERHEQLEIKGPMKYFDRAVWACALLAFPGLLCLGEATVPNKGMLDGGRTPSWAGAGPCTRSAVGSPNTPSSACPATRSARGRARTYRSTS